MEGIVVRLVRDRGFGFIAAPDGNEYFFHATGCIGRVAFAELREQQPVDFEIGKSPKGLRAIDVEAR